VEFTALTTTQQKILLTIHNKTIDKIAKKHYNSKSMKGKAMIHATYRLSTGKIFKNYFSSKDEAIRWIEKIAPHYIKAANGRYFYRRGVEGLLTITHLAV
jgi:histidinol dehydrogenase